MEHRNAELRQMTGFGAPGDNAARFLSELRRLRDGAGLGQAELAARAHFPYDFIKAAEAGPDLPDLPVLSAYVRACGGTVEEWEERWRSLTRTPSLPVAASRQGGRSDAATAGARISSAARDADSPDPSVIMAALDRVAEGMASPSEGDFSFAETTPAPGAPAPLAPEPAAADPLVPGPVAPNPVAAGLANNDKAAGWDPIRVSTAWPVLSDTSAPLAAPPGPLLPPPAVAQPWATGANGAGAQATEPVAAPWGPAPWATTPPSPAAPPPVSNRPADTQAAATAPATSQGQQPSSAMIVVIAAVVLCVLAVLLAVFA